MIFRKNYGKNTKNYDEIPKVQLLMIVNCCYRHSAHYIIQLKFRASTSGVLCRRYWSTMRIVLKYYADGTGVLRGWYWSTTLIVLEYYPYSTGAAWALNIRQAAFGKNHSSKFDGFPLICIIFP